MPSLRNEAYRFCDVSSILKSNLQARTAARHRYLCCTSTLTSLFCR